MPSNNTGTTENATPRQHPMTIAAIEMIKHVRPRALDSGSPLIIKMIPTTMPTMGTKKDNPYKTNLRQPLYRGP